MQLLLDLDALELSNSVDQSLCYAGSGTASLLPVLEEATFEVATRVLVFILTVNND